MVWCLQRATLHPALYAAVGVGLVLIGIPICSQAAIRFGRSDPPQVVFDEIAAFPLVFAVVAVDFTTGVLGFFWFRLFDILKPWPVKQLEKLPTGAGIMADDLAAAVYAAVALWGTVQILN